MNVGSMTTIGLLLVLTGYFSYLLLLFVIYRFTYRTWIFDVIIGLGIAATLIGYAFGGNAVVIISSVILRCCLVSCDQAAVEAHRIKQSQTARW